MLSWLRWKVVRIGIVGRGRAIGTLSAWLAWERLTTWLWRPKPVQPGGALRFIPRIYRGPTLQLRDGTTVRPGDRILDLHFDNRVLSRLARVPGWTPWRALRMVASDLAILAEIVSPGRADDVVALHGATLFASVGQRFGMEYRAAPRTLGWAVAHYYLVGIIAIYHPRGWAGARRAQLRAWPGEVWISREALVKMYPPEDE